jgi:hypothetical protein
MIMVPHACAVLSPDFLMLLLQLCNKPNLAEEDVAVQAHPS